MYLLFVPLALLALAYLWIIGSFYRGWQQMPCSNTPQAHQAPTSITVLIAVRNEAQHINRLIAQLTDQEYPPQLCEFVIINDHSTDGSLEMLRHAAQTCQQLRLANLATGQTGKKAAIGLGHRLATGQLIACTDADCQFGPHWLSAMAHYYETTGKRFLIGPVDMPPTNSSFFQLYQTVEFMSLIGSTAGAVGCSKPIMCNGANLAYERNLALEYTEMMQAEHASGDDVFLMLAVKKAEPDVIGFVKNREAVVCTQPLPSLSMFWNQRVRWASKSRLYTDRDVIATALVVLMLNLSLSLLLLCAAFCSYCLVASVVVLLLKSAIDWPLLRSIKRFYGTHNYRLALVFWPVQVLYPLYVGCVSVYSFFGSFSWKQRRYN